MRFLVALLALTITSVAAPAHANHSHGYATAARSNAKAGIITTITGPGADYAANYWSRLAGWPILQVSDSRFADVQIEVRDGTGAETYPSTPCLIFTSSVDAWTISHEAGHCFGFADHDECTDTYCGILAYGSQGQVNETHDQAMLDHAGLTGHTTPQPPGPRDPWRILLAWFLMLLGIAT